MSMATKLDMEGEGGIYNEDFPSIKSQNYVKK